MKKTINKIIATILFLLLLCGALFYDAISVAPSRFSLRYENFSSSKIPQQLDGLNILFLSDVYYNHFMDEKRFQKVVDLVKAASPDVIIFLGDLVDPEFPLNAEQAVKLTQQLSELSAPLGKFAVLGDNDILSFSTRENITSILQSSGFEMITNKSVNIRNHGSQSITLVGIDSIYKGSPDISSTLSNVNRESFILMVSHAPDIINTIPQNLIDLQVSGHSLGGQIYFPILGGDIVFEGATTYQRGKHTVDGTKLDISNGVGTTGKDVRFLASAELLIYTLHTKKR